MARRTHQFPGARIHGARHLPNHPARHHRRARRRRAARSGVLGALALCRAPHHRAAHRGRRPGARALLRVLAVGPDARVQGAADGHPAPGILSRSPVSRLRDGDRGLSPALFDQHQPELAAGAALPPAGTQRRDQHPVGQPQRDGCPRAGARLAPVGRARGAPEAHHLGRGERFREPRQRPRVARALGARPRARPDDALARGSRRRHRDGVRAAGVLRVPRMSDRAVGRPGRPRVLGRHPGGLGPRP